MAAIGVGTKNVGVNVTLAERKLLNGLAFRKGTDAGKLIRHYYLIALAAEHPDVAQQITSAREAHRDAVEHRRAMGQAKRYGKPSPTGDRPGAVVERVIEMGEPKSAPEELPESQKPPAPGAPPFQKGRKSSSGQRGTKGKGRK